MLWKLNEINLFSYAHNEFWFMKMTFQISPILSGTILMYAPHYCCHEYWVVNQFNRPPVNKMTRLQFLPNYVTNFFFLIQRMDQ